MIISKSFRFDSAHKLENYKGKCENLHGHSFKLIVSCSGEADPETGMIMDFHELGNIVEGKIISKLDHSYLNDIIKNPTCENTLLWIKNELKNSKLKNLKKLALYETDDAWCELEC